MSALVEVEGLSVAYRDGGREVPVVSGVSLQVAAGSTVALVGESGSGKSTVAAALLGFLRPGSRRTAGDVRIDGRDVFALPRGALRELRGATVAMVAQNAGAVLTPSMRVGRQIDEALRAHDARGRRQRTAELMGQVQLSARMVDRYPHELSGGQQQRVVIAMAIAARPRVLVLDEPTTGLDVLTQRGIIDLLAGLTGELDLATVLVSHDLGVVAAMADDVHVLRAGATVETAAAAQLFTRPAHPYTRELLAAVPRLANGPVPAAPIPAAPVPGAAAPVVVLEHVSAGYGDRTVLDDVSVELRAGEVLGLVGESGSGKSTLAAALAGLHPASAGEMRYLGDGAGDLGVAAAKRPKSLRRRVALVMQNADTSLNPRRSVRDAVRRPLTMFGIGERSGRDGRVEALLRDVGLDPAMARRLPVQLSGGQRQRVGIARALAGGPDVVIADEITTALDVSVQAQVLTLLDALRREHGLACLFISHDLAVVRGIADRIVVLHGGRIVEQGPTAAVFAGPNHPYTRALIAATLEPDPDAAAAAEPGPAWAHDDAAGWIDAGPGHRIRPWRAA